MPIYDMKCPQCHEIETIFCHHSMKDCFTCSKCDCKLVEKPTAPDFIIKGYRAKNNYE